MIGSMLTIKTKIILLYTLATGVILGLFAFYIYENYKEAELATIDARLESYAARLSTILEESGDEPGSPDPKILIGNYSKNFPGIRIQLSDRSGNILAGDGSISGKTALARERSFIENRHFEDIIAGEGAYRSIWVPVDVNDRDVSTLQIASPLSEYENNLFQLRIIFFIIIPCGLLSMAIAAHFITGYAFRPMLGMVETAKTITGSNLHRRLTLPRAHDEVRTLGETLNDMIERIRASFDSQKQFIADASHEIRTPLTVMCSELEYAAQHTSEASVKECLQTSLAEIDRLTKLADGLLMLAKLDSSQLTLTKQIFRLDELLIECIQFVSPMAEKKKIRIRINLEEPVEIFADREKIKSIIFNLLDNAIKYSCPDTVVTASLSPINIENKSATLSIADEGVGIPENAIPNIFKRFYRVDSSRTENPGSGLGLAIVDRLVALHEGKISVQSKVGEGSAFSIFLPIKV
ncbi:MAG: sensor histidine kinase [Bacteroidota bacterium]